MTARNLPSTTPVLDRIIADLRAGTFRGISGGEPTEAEKAAAGGTTVAVTATPAAATTTATTETPAPAPVTPAPRVIQVSEETYLRYLEGERKLSQIAKEKAEADEAAEAIRLKALADKGESDKAFAEMRESSNKKLQAAESRAAALQSELLAGELDRTVSAAMLGRDFLSPEAAGQFRRLVADKFEATRDETGRVKVAERGTGRAVAEAMADAFADVKQYGHFFKPTHKGGAGSQGTDTTATTAAPSNLPFDQQLVLNMRAAAKTTTTAYGLAVPAGLVPADTRRN
jgi:hypothetical protein